MQKLTLLMTIGMVLTLSMAVGMVNSAEETAGTSCHICQKDTCFVGVCSSGHCNKVSCGGKTVAKFCGHAGEPAVCKDDDDGCTTCSCVGDLCNSSGKIDIGGFFWCIVPVIVTIVLLRGY